MIMRLSTVVMSLAFLVGSFPVLADDLPPQATIHMANHGGIQDWRADGENGLFIMDREYHWYHATLMAPCINLPFRTSNLGFETEVNGDFDNFSFVTAGRERCQVVSLVKSAAPPDAPKSERNRVNEDQSH